MLRDLASTNGVFVNDERLTASRVLVEGDVIRVGGGAGAGGGGGGEDSPLVYAYERMSAVVQRQVGEVCSLQAGVQLDGGTKVLHLSSSSHRPAADEPARPARAKSAVVRLSASGLRFMIEDDQAAGTEELLFLQLNNVSAVAQTSAQQRQISVTVERLQLDNQFDARTPFPVVISLAPSNCPAFKLALVEKLGQTGLRNYFNHVAVQLGSPYIFVEDRLIARMGLFLGRFKQRRTRALRTTAASARLLRSQASPSTAAAGETTCTTPLTQGSTAKAGWSHHWSSQGMVGGRGAVLEGINDDVAELFLRVCTEAASDDTALAAGSSGEYVYIDHLKWAEWRLHLTLMLLGGDSNKVLRQYGGRIVERMLRNIRLDDVVVKIAAVDKRRQLRTKSAMAGWLSKKIASSARKSFFSSKFLFKGLDAYKDAFLGKQLNAQMAGEQILRRLRPIEGPGGGGDACGLDGHVEKTVSSRAMGTVTNVASVAVGTVSAAGSVASTAASTAGAAAGYMANAVADTVQGTPLHAATTVASTAKSAASSAASMAKKAAKTGVQKGFKSLGSFFS